MNFKRYKIDYIQKGGDRFDSLPNDTYFKLKPETGEGEVSISKQDLIKYPDSLLTIIVKKAIDWEQDIDLDVPIKLFNLESLQKIVFFYQHDYWNFNPFIYSQRDQVPRVIGEDHITSINSLVDFLMLPKTALSFKTEEKEGELDLPGYLSDDGESETEYVLPNKVKSHHQKMAEHHFLKGNDKYEYDSDY